jgi:hypothetical protein
VGRACGTHGRGREKCSRFWWESKKEKNPLRRPKGMLEDGIRMDVREIGWGVWIGFDWPQIATGGELL